MSRGNSQRGGCPGLFLMVSGHAQETPRSRGLHATKPYHRQLPAPNPQKSRGGKEGREDVAKACFQVQNHLEVSEQPLAVEWPRGQAEISKWDLGRALSGLLTPASRRCPLSYRAEREKEERKRQAGRLGASGECVLCKRAASEVKNRGSDLRWEMHWGLACSTRKWELTVRLL